MINSLKNIHQSIHKAALPLATGIGVFVVSFLVMWMVFARISGISQVKQELVKLIASLNEAGYDIAYDKISFSPISPFSIAKIKNFQLYNNEWKWRIAELNINAGLLNFGNMSIKPSEKQEFVRDGESHPVDMSEANILLSFDNNGLYSILAEARKININGLADIKSLQAAVQRSEDKETKVYVVKLDARNIDLADNSLNMENNIEEIFADLKINGGISNGETYRQSMRLWQENGGDIEVNKLIINWKPLVMVGKGNLAFDENLEPQLQLVTTSKGLIETLDNLGKAGAVDSKNVFVAKILLGNKAQKIAEGKDDYSIMAPIFAAPGKVMIENIPIIEEK